MTTVRQLEKMIAKAVPVARKNGFRLETGLFLHGNCCCPLTAVVIARHDLKPKSRVMRQMDGAWASTVRLATKLSEEQNNAFIEGVDSSSYYSKSRLPARMHPFFKLGRKWRERILHARAQRRTRVKRRRGF